MAFVAMRGTRAPNVDIARTARLAAFRSVMRARKVAIDTFIIVFPSTFAKCETQSRNREATDRMFTAIVWYKKLV
eukprot:24240_5